MHVVLTDVSFFLHRLYFKSLSDTETEKEKYFLVHQVRHVSVLNLYLHVFAHAHKEHVISPLLSLFVIGFLFVDTLHGSEGATPSQPGHGHWVSSADRSG